MSRDNLQHIDKLIDSALRSERERDVPPGFQNRVMERISAEALESAQAAQRTHRFVRPAVFMTVLAAAMLVVPMLSFYGQWTRQALPGGMGILDYALAWVDLSRMGSLADVTVAALSAVAVGVALLGVGWAFARLRGTRQQTER